MNRLLFVHYTFNKQRTYCFDESHLRSVTASWCYLPLAICNIISTYYYDMALKMYYISSVRSSLWLKCQHYHIIKMLTPTVHLDEHHCVIIL